MSYEKITLENLLNGALEEKFQYELDRIKKNIKDINTDWNKAREVTITLSLKCNEERTNIQCSAAVKSKIAPVKESIGILKIAQKSNGDLDIVQDNTTQEELFKNIDLDDEKLSNEINIKKALNQ